MAADRIRERYTTALGELDGLIYMSRDLDKEIDLNQLAFRSDGRKKLDELRQRLTQVEAASPALAAVHERAALPAPGMPLRPVADEDKWAERLRKPHA